MVFILGGRGLVGSAFVRYCQRSGRPFIIIDRQNYASYVGESCEVFVNANGNSRKWLAEHAPLEDFDASVRSVRASLVDFNYRRYVHLSSCDVYPDCSSPEATLESRPLDPTAESPYGFHKYLAEQCVRHSAPEWLVFRCGGFVGPGLEKNAIYDILHGGPLFLDPDSELQFLHTDQAAEIILRIVDAGSRNEVINLCGKGVIRLREIVELVGRPVVVNPRSPRVRYEISLAKMSAMVRPPETRPTVLDFVREQLG